LKTLMITGGAGFIGSNFARHILGTYPKYRVVVYDKLTYAGNMDNLRDLTGSSRFAFVKGDIADAGTVAATLRDHRVDTIVNFAAESHVDRSILNPDAFIQTDVYGTYVLLEAARAQSLERFLQVSTDEVYGSTATGAFKETDPLAPNSPYSASKAGGELMVRAYHQTYGLSTLVTRGSNTFGPFQYPEKLASLFITNAMDDLPLPVYGDGKQVRDWLYVLDHCRGIDVVLHRGTSGEVYNVGGENERFNLDVTELLISLLGKPRSLIRYVPDRPGHDRRYALDCTKIKTLGWLPRRDWETAMGETVQWYRENEWWWRKIKSGEFEAYYRQQYAERLARSRDRVDAEKQS
jgi:dTDP-glucose 4,6-dehydratase